MVNPLGGISEGSGGGCRSSGGGWRRWWWWVTVVEVETVVAVVAVATEGSFWVVEGADRHPQSRAFTPCRDDNRASFVPERATLRRVRWGSRRELSCPEWSSVSSRAVVSVVGRIIERCGARALRDKGTVCWWCSVRFSVEDEGQIPGRCSSSKWRVHANSSVISRPPVTLGKEGSQVADVYDPFSVEHVVERGESSCDTRGSASLSSKFEVRCPCGTVDRLSSKNVLVRRTSIPIAVEVATGADIRGVGCKRGRERCSPTTARSKVNLVWAVEGLRSRSRKRVYRRRRDYRRVTKQRGSPSSFDSATLLVENTVTWICSRDVINRCSFAFYTGEPSIRWRIRCDRESTYLCVRVSILTSISASNRG